MTETTDKKVRIFNVANDMNISSVAIIEFLESKGYTAIGPMSMVDNDMMKNITSHSFNDYKNVICPRCANSISVREGITILSCFTCGLQFRVEPERQIQYFFYRLFVKIKSFLPRWVKTNWSKVIAKAESTILSETIIYESHCWYCQSPIKSVKTEAKGKHFLKYQISVLWLGNKKCPKAKCIHFLCNNCGRCFCDYDNLDLRLPSPVIEKKWLEENP